MSDLKGFESISIEGLPPEYLPSCGDVHSDSLRMLRHLNKINIFVGPTNSGKSRFLRGLLKKQTYKVLLIALGEENDEPCVLSTKPNTADTSFLSGRSQAGLKRSKLTANA